MRFSSPLIDQTIEYDETHHILICKVCRIGIKKSCVQSHFYNQHHYKQDVWKSFRDAVKDLPALDDLDLFPRLPNGSSVHPNLKLSRDGYECNICGICSANESVMNNHGSVHRKEGLLRYGNKFYKKVYGVQVNQLITLFNS